MRGNVSKEYDIVIKFTGSYAGTVITQNCGILIFSYHFHNNRTILPKNLSKTE